MFTFNFCDRAVTSFTPWLIAYSFLPLTASFSFIWGRFICLLIFIVLSCSTTLSSEGPVASCVIQTTSLNSDLPLFHVPCISIFIPLPLLLPTHSSSPSMIYLYRFIILLSPFLHRPSVFIFSVLVIHWFLFLSSSVASCVLFKLLESSVFIFSSAFCLDTCKALKGS